MTLTLPPTAWATPVACSEARSDGQARPARPLQAQVFQVSIPCPHALRFCLTRCDSNRLPLRNHPEGSAASPRAPSLPLSPPAGSWRRQMLRSDRRFPFTSLPGVPEATGSRRLSVAQSYSRDPSVAGDCRVSTGPGRRGASGLRAFSGRPASTQAR